MSVTEYRGGLRRTEWSSVRWARKVRDELRVRLGGKCVKCRGWYRLTFDHINPVGWHASSFSWSQRMAEYKRAADEGNLQLLCIRCHGKKSRSDQVALDLLRTDQHNPF